MKKEWLENDINFSILHLLKPQLPMLRVLMFPVKCNSRKPRFHK